MDAINPDRDFHTMFHLDCMFYTTFTHILLLSSLIPDWPWDGCWPAQVPQRLHELQRHVWQRQGRRRQTQHYGHRGPDPRGVLLQPRGWDLCRGLLSRFKTVFFLWFFLFGVALSPASYRQLIQLQCPCSPSHQVLHPWSITGMESVVLPAHHDKGFCILFPVCPEPSSEGVIIILVGMKYFVFGMFSGDGILRAAMLLGVRKLMYKVHSWKKGNSRSSKKERTEKNVICIVLYIGSLAPLYEVCHTQSR